MNSTNSFRNLYKQLPQKTREVLAFENFDMFIREIKEVNRLSESQIYTLIRLTVQVIVGTEKNENFPNRVKEMLQVEQNVANIISSEIESKITHNIENIHQQIQHILGEDTEEASNDSLVQEVREAKKYLENNDFIEIFKGAKLPKGTTGLLALLKRAPQHVQKSLTSPEWLKRIKELGLKYSLQETQITELILESLLVISEALPEEDFEENIKSEVDVSQILAQQLGEEINERVFKWFKQEQELVVKNAEEGSAHENTLDIPPPNLPSEDLAEEAPVLWTKQEPLAQLQETTHTILEEQVTPPTPPQHQETYSFKADITPKPEPDTVITPPTPRTSFIENKLSQPVKPASPVAPPQSYVSDPYREPLE